MSLPTINDAGIRMPPNQPNASPEKSFKITSAAAFPAPIFRADCDMVFLVTGLTISCPNTDGNEGIIESIPPLSLLDLVEE